MTARSSDNRRSFTHGWPLGACSLVFVVFLVPVIPVRAQLGATPGVMRRMYGPMLRHNARIWHREVYDSDLMDGDIYCKDDLFVRAAFRGGMVELLEFCTTTRVLTQKDVDHLLSINAAGSRWELGPDSTAAAKFYRREDGGAIAQWAVGDNGSLLVSAENLGGFWEKLLW